MSPAGTKLELSEDFRASLADRGIELQEEIGRGAMSVVYRGIDQMDLPVLHARLHRIGSE